MGHYTHRGFTLVELILVIVLVGILSVYALPRLDSLTSYDLNQSTNELIEAIRFAQETSMIRVNTQYQIVTGAPDIYRVQQYTSSASDISNPLTGASSFTADSNDWAGISVTAVNLSFDTRGYPCASTAPCSTHMTNPLTIDVSASGETRSITIEPLTGFVHE